MNVVKAASINILSVDYENICSNQNILNAVRIIGDVVNILKWIVPIIIIIFGVIDFVKAVVSSDEDASSKASKALLRRFISGVAVFLVPTILFGILNIIEVTTDIQSEFIACTECILDVSTCK